MLLFAQGAGVAAALVMMLVCFGLVLVFALIIAFFFLRTLSRALEHCHPDTRTMNPGQVWLNFIPCFNVVWQFVTVIRVGDSLKLEFADRRMDEGGDYGKTLGLAWLILSMVGGVVQNLPEVIAPNDQNVALIGMGLGGVMSITQLVLFVLYWVRIAGYSRQLADDEYQDRRDDDDDRPPRRRPPADEDDGYDDPPR
jgi:heme/copper-type cytochrome/quinol oxidase subunit 2